MGFTKKDKRGKVSGSRSGGWNLRLSLYVRKRGNNENGIARLGVKARSSVEDISMNEWVSSYLGTKGLYIDMRESGGQ